MITMTTLPTKDNFMIIAEPWKHSLKRCACLLVFDRPISQ